MSIIVNDPLCASHSIGEAVECDVQLTVLCLSLSVLTYPGPCTLVLYGYIESSWIRDAHSVLSSGMDNYMDFGVSILSGCTLVPVVSILCWWYWGCIV